MAGNFNKKTDKIYLDYAATTPVDPEVEKAMRPYFGRKFGNPGSLHFFGQEAMAGVDESREKIAAAIGADFREIIFTGSATEANNLALRGAVREFRIQNLEYRKLLNPRIIVSSIEHESILATARDLESSGIEVIYLPVSRAGFVDLKKLKAALNEQTVLVSIMHANNEIGTIQPIAEIAEIIGNFRATSNKRHVENSRIAHVAFPILHSDVAQSFQYLDCDVNKLGVDLMTLSGHKIYGPKGVGALYVRSLNSKFCILNSILTGGGQEFGFRSGTENVPLIVGFAKAVELAVENREQESKRIKNLRDYFWHGFKKIFPRAAVNGSFTNRLPNNLNICLPGYSAEDLLVKLDLTGIAVSSGSACSARSVKLSSVLAAIGCNEKRIRQSLRFTFGKFTEKSELDEALKRIKNIIYG
ncbi:MAG: cysteine desulfurase [Candidatus Brennerbacteria bacterium]|nr:cysteine desulfurase [Candidatus Brennerbacteria bacterium]